MYGVCRLGLRIYFTRDRNRVLQEPLLAAPLEAPQFGILIYFILLLFSLVRSYVRCLLLDLADRDMLAF